MITAFFNHKGGVGKSTTTVNLAAGLAKEGYRVLVIDMDAQHNATDYLGVLVSRGDATIYDLLFESADPHNSICRTSIESLFCIPSSDRMINASLRLNQDQIAVPSARLYAALKKFGIRSEYDFIFLDCPSDLDAVSANALNAADNCIVPCFPDRFSKSGLVNVLDAIDKAAENGCGTEIKLLGILLCNFRGMTKTARQNLEEIRASIPEETFQTVIRQSAAIPDSIECCRPVVLMPKSPATEDYLKLTAEYLLRTQGTKMRMRFASGK